MYLIADWQELLGIITIILGPVCAWVSSWILYVFGELVEDIHATRDKEGKANREVEESQDTFKLAEPEENFVPIPSKTVIPNKYKDSYSCPKCGCTLKFVQKECLCSWQMDWSKYK